MTLYVKTNCAFCAIVLAKVDELGIKVDERNISDKVYAAELIEKGGKRQVPFLIDEECGVSMFESSDIIDYLNKKYRTGEAASGSEGVSPLGACPQ